MRKILFMSICFCAFSSVNAQEYKLFQMYLGIGSVISDGGGGYFGNLDPAYRINDQIAVGLRFEVAYITKEVRGFIFFLINITHDKWKVLFWRESFPSLYRSRAWSLYNF